MNISKPWQDLGMWKFEENFVTWQHDFFMKFHGCLFACSIPYMLHLCNIYPRFTINLSSIFQSHAAFGNSQVMALGVSEATFGTSKATGRSKGDELRIETSAQHVEKCWLSGRGPKIKYIQAWEFWYIYPETWKDGSFWDETMWLWATQRTKDTKGWLWVERGAGFNNKKTLGWYCYFYSGIRIPFTCASTWNCSVKVKVIYFFCHGIYHHFQGVLFEVCPTNHLVYCVFCPFLRNLEEWKSLPKGLRTEVLKLPRLKPEQSTQSINRE